MRNPVLAPRLVNVIMKFASEFCAPTSKMSRAERRKLRVNGRRQTGVTDTTIRLRAHKALTIDASCGRYSNRLQHSLALARREGCAVAALCVGGLCVRIGSPTNRPTCARAYTHLKLLCTHSLAAHLVASCGCDAVAANSEAREHRQPTTDL